MGRDCWPKVLEERACLDGSCARLELTSEGVSWLHWGRESCDPRWNVGSVTSRAEGRFGGCLEQSGRHDIEVGYDLC